MTALSTIAVAAAAMVVAAGWTPPDSSSNHGRTHARRVATARQTVRPGTASLAPRRWVGPDHPMMSHDEQPGWLLRDVGQDRLSA